MVEMTLKTREDNYRCSNPDNRIGAPSTTSSSHTEHTTQNVRTLTSPRTQTRTLEIPSLTTLTCLTTGEGRKSERKSSSSRSSKAISTSRNHMNKMSVAHASPETSLELEGIQCNEPEQWNQCVEILVRHESRQTNNKKTQTKRDSRWVYTSTMTLIFALIFLFLQISIIPPSSASEMTTTTRSGSESSSKNDDDPLNSFLQKLALFSTTESSRESDRNESALFDPTKLFDNIVNAKDDTDYYDQTSRDENERGQNSNEGKSLREINHFDTSSSTEFNCHHEECLPTPLPLQLRFSNSNSNEFHPTVLPKWNAVMATKSHSSQSQPTKFSHSPSPSLSLSDENNELIPQIKITNKYKHLQNNKESNDKSDMKEFNKELGPLRIFKYIHHPDEIKSTTAALLPTPTTSATPTTTTAKPKVNQNQDQRSTFGEKVNAKSSEEVVEGTLTVEQYDELIASAKASMEKEEKELSSERTRQEGETLTAERSLIRNSFFSGKTEAPRLNPNETTTIVINGTLGPDGFRPRRSPFRPHWHHDKLYTHREALYQINPPPHVHPPPPGLSPIPHSALYQLQSPMMSRKSFIAHSPSPGPGPAPGPSPIPVVAIPVRVSGPMPLGYQNDIMNIASIDREFNSPHPSLPDAESPEEQSSFRLPNFQHPFSKSKHKKRPPLDGRTAASGPGSRRPPPPRHRHGPQRGRHPGPVPSVMPPPRPIPVPRPRPQMHISPSGRHTNHGPRPPPATIPYSYPKDAANIQDILSYFNTEENEILGTHGKPPLSSSASGNMNSGIGMGGFSNELRDVQGSLLKDIREFANRPNMLVDDKIHNNNNVHNNKNVHNNNNLHNNNNNHNNNRDHSREREREKENSKPIPVPVPPPDDRDNDPMDDVFDPKPKPVRDLIKVRHHGRHRDRESSREQESGGGGGSGNRDRGRYHHRSPSERSPQDEEDNEHDNSNNNGKRHRHQHSYSSSSNSNSHNNNNDSQERDKNNNKGSQRNNNYNSQSQLDDEYSKELEQAQRPRYRDRNRQQQSSGQSSGNHRDHHRQHSSHYKPKDNPDKQEDTDSDERQYSNNLQSSSSPYSSRERERNRERDRGQSHGYTNSYSPHSNSNSNSNRNSHKAHRPHKSHRSRPKNRSRHRQKGNKFQYSESHLHERFRQRLRDSNRNNPIANSRERGPPASWESNPAGGQSVSAMDTAYYMQRNRPIIIKRPYQPYRPVPDLQKVEQERKNQDKYWNTVTTLNVNDNKVEPTINRPPQQLSLPLALPPPRPPTTTLQKHYHYYGVGSNQPFPQPAVGGVPSTSERMSSSTLRPHPYNFRNNAQQQNEGSHGSPEEEDILEIHTGSSLTDIGTTPNYPPPENTFYERDKKARLQKMYMDYLQKKLEAQAEAQAESMIPSTTPPSPKPAKRPMRMKIHIYPNENTHFVERTNSGPGNPIFHSNPHSRPHLHSPSHSNFISASTNKAYGPNFNSDVHRSGSSYGHYSQPMGHVSPPTLQINPPQNPLNTNVHQQRPNSNQAAGEKNKNVVLHLHVHRRNGVDHDNEGHMDMAGSEAVTSTTKPLTYEEIYETSNSDNFHMAENPPENTEADEDINMNTQIQPEELHVQSSGPINHERSLDVVDSDKSLSMELPIHQDKIEDVLSTLLKLRN